MPLSLQWFKNNCQKIHFFGLGFIQIKISDTVRYHFYTRRLESIMPVEETHNHRYDFTSYILKGCLRQEIFQPDPPLGNQGEYRIWDVSCEPGQQDVEYPMLWTSIPILDVTLQEGSDYRLPHHVFHRVSSDNCITRIERGERLKERASVLRKVGAKQVCPFSRIIPEELLWEIVEDMIRI